MSRWPQLDALRGGPGIIRVHGHRGARGVMPENTLPGFRFALASGVEILEFDVVMTADNVPVITHNHHLAASATRDKAGAWLVGPAPKVSELSFAEIAEFNVGGLDGSTVYGQRFPDQVFLNHARIPRLSDLLALISKPAYQHVHLLLELKSDPAAKGRARGPREIIVAVLNDIRASGLESRTVLHSFDWAFLAECQALAPDLPTSFLSQRPENDKDAGEDSSQHASPDFDDGSQSIPRMVKKAGGQMWCPYYSDARLEDVRAAQAMGLLVTVWTANEVEDIDRMISLGVDGIVTDYPGRLQRRLLAHGLHWKGDAPERD